METIPFVKGHGTENDFVLLPDADANFVLGPEVIQHIADRHTGVGGDGVIRVAKSQALIDQGIIEPENAHGAQWFMDYYNADGSTAEMCGNGVRVFAHYLASQGLEEEKIFRVGTRAGVKKVKVWEADSTHAVVSVDMGKVTLGPESTASLGGHMYTGVSVDVGNPHLVSVQHGLTPQALHELSFTPPVLLNSEIFPDGTNIEVLTPLEDGQVYMRVYERGVGETRSCGTGTVAAALAALVDKGMTPSPQESVKVTIPGGQVTISFKESEQGALPEAVLTGPSELVFSGVLSIHTELRPVS